MGFQIVEVDSGVITLEDDSGNKLQVVNDSGNYLLGVITKVLNSSGSQINPSTEDTLSAVDTKLGTIDGVLDAIKDTDGVKKITDALPAGTNLLGKVQIRNPGNTLDLGDATNPVRTDPTGTTTQPISAATLPLPSGAATESTLSAADTKLGTIDSVLDSIKDTDGIKKITDALPTGDNTIGRVKITDGSEVVDVVTDTEDGINRLQIKGKVSVSAPTAPPTATSVTLASDTPLSISTTQEDDYVIPNTETFTVTSVVAGAEGDPTEKGSKVEVIYYDGTTEHLIDRIYLSGQTVSIYPDTSQARDGTSLTGDGSTKTIILRRLRLSGATQEVDAVLRGYVQ